MTQSHREPPGDDLKIRRYMDLSKFVLMLTQRALWIPSLACLKKMDPYEGYLPQAHIESLFKVVNPVVTDIEALRPAFLEQSEEQASTLDAIGAQMKVRMNESFRLIAERFGVSCWHPEKESEAMWKLYAGSGQGIAIETTVGKLRNCLRSLREPEIDWVRYRNFETAPFESNQKRYLGWIKPEGFQHEQEIRAMVFFGSPQYGLSLSIEPESFFERVHLSPFADPLLKTAIYGLCRSKLLSKSLLIEESTLRTAPAYKLFKGV